MHKRIACLFAVILILLLPKIAIGAEQYSQDITNLRWQATNDFTNENCSHGGAIYFVGDSASGVLNAQYQHAQQNCKIISACQTSEYSPLIVTRGPAVAGQHGPQSGW